MAQHWWSRSGQRLIGRTGLGEDFLFDNHQNCEAENDTAYHDDNVEGENSHAVFMGQV